MRGARALREHREEEDDGGEDEDASKAGLAVEEASIVIGKENPERREKIKKGTNYIFFRLSKEGKLSDAPHRHVFRRRAAR